MEVSILSKENFWDDIEKQYPEAFSKFSAWIDDYKKKINWNYIFGNYGNSGRDIKFHHLPIELQVGVIGKFFIDVQNGDNSSRIWNEINESNKVGIVELFSVLQDSSKTSQNGNDDIDTII